MARLLAEAATYAPAACTHTSMEHLTTINRADARAPHQLTVHAGTLLQASSAGLLSIPFLEHLKPAELSALHHCMDAHTVEAALSGSLPFFSVSGVLLLLLLLLLLLRVQRVLYDGVGFGVCTCCFRH